MSNEQLAIMKLRRQKFLRLGILGLFLVIGIWLVNTTLALQAAAKKPVEALLVLGGSITREIHVAELAKQYPQIPVLISKGSQDPCILLIFQRAKASLENVWVEKCADSTFGNFYYSLPILKEWKVHKIKLITSPTHLPRAKWMGQIILGAKGIWVEPDIVKEKGIPGNRENSLTTVFDVSRSLLWAVMSQFYSPRCAKVTPLSQVSLVEWKAKGFKCERQGNLKY